MVKMEAVKCRISIKKMKKTQREGVERKGGRERERER